MQPSWPKINQLPLTRFLEKRLVRVKSRVYGKLWWSCREIIAFSSIIDYPFVESQSTLRKRWFCLKYFFRNFEEASQKVSRSFFFPFSFVLFSFFLSFFLFEMLLFKMSFQWSDLFFSQSFTNHFTAMSHFINAWKSQETFGL